MANTKSAAKRARQSESRSARNSSIQSALKTSQKKFRELIAAGKLEEATKELRAVSAHLDKAAKRGTIHKNSADRKKSAFARAVKRAA